MANLAMWFPSKSIILAEITETREQLPSAIRTGLWEGNIFIGGDMMQKRYSVIYKDRFNATIINRSLAEATRNEAWDHVVTHLGQGLAGGTMTLYMNDTPISSWPNPVSTKGRNEL